MWKLFVSVLFILGIAGLTGCGNDGADGRTVIRIAYLPITHSAAVMVLPEVTQNDPDFYIQLVRFTAWPEVVEALNARRVDGASILLEVAMNVFNMDNTLTAVSLSHRDGNVIVVDNTIECYTCLIGRTVAIPHPLSPHNTLLRMVLERENIPVGALNLRDISPAEMPFSMAARAISAYVVAEPWGTLAEVRGVGRILETSNEALPRSVCCVVIFNSAVFDQYPGLYEWFIGEFARAAEYVQARDEKVFRAFHRSTSFEREIIERSLENTCFEDLTFTREDFYFATDLILRFDILSRIPNFNDFVR